MRRISLRIGTAALAFAVGLSSALLPGFAPRSMKFFGEPAADVPAAAMNGVSYRCLESYDVTRTTDDFGQFWAEFKSAVARDDRERLYALTEHGEFEWTTGGLSLGRHACGKSSLYYFLIRDYDEFDRNYELIFTPEVREAILTGAPEPFGSQTYNLYFEGDARGRREKLVLEFGKFRGAGFKFDGMGPGVYYD